MKTYRRRCDTDPLTGAQSCHDEPVYYAEWEQEYGALGGPPFPSPTPYGFKGRNFVFGQRVEIAPLHALVTATAGPRIEAAGVTTDTLQLYRIAITWTNPTGADVPVRYDAQVRLRAITQAGGSVRTDSGWGMTSLALSQAGGVSLPSSIPSGESNVVVPIAAPPGKPKIVEISFPTQLGEEAEATPTTNADLQNTDAQYLTVQWVNSGFDYYGAPACSDPGALTDWGSGNGGPGAVAAPEGVSRLIQLALAQVGKPYIWGAKGPNAFDCSGLATWSYAQIGITIPQGTAGQWPRLKPVSQGELHVGDLVYFNTDEPARSDITHVGILAGDLNDDGKWDMVHAASPKLGVRVDYDIFNSRYYGPRIRGFRTAR